MAQPKERRECKVCGKRFTVSAKLRSFCSVRCQKEGKRLGSFEAQRRIQQRKQEEAAQPARPFMSVVQFFPVPDSKGQADFHSGLMV